MLTEICCTKAIEVDEGLAAAFHSSDPKAIQEIFKLIELQADTFKENIDLIAGTIGLRFHRQFVIEILAENPIAFKSDGAPTQPYSSNVAEVLENLSMKETGAAALQSMLQQVAGASKKAQAFGASALRWLLRAWRESDPFSRFMALFIPIEVVLSAVKYDENEIAQQRAFDRQLEGILRDHGGTDSDALIAGYKKLRQLVHPPLSARFECLAEEAQIDGWKGDILAFRRFNSLRNNVLHYGGKAIEMEVTVGDDKKQETRSIEDLAERYVLWVLFRSKEPFKTRYRPERTPDID
jgi:hypothetical protein